MMEPIGDETRARLLHKLRQLAPKRVRVLAGDDEARDIAVPERRRKWAQVIEAIEAQPWMRVEMLDKAGLVLGYVENDGPAGDLEDVGVPAAMGTPRMAELRGIVELVLRAQREALAQRNAEVSTILAGAARVMEMVTSAFPQMMQIMMMQRDAAADVARLQAEAASPRNGGDEFDPMDLVKLAADPDAVKALMPLLFGLRQLTAGPPPKAASSSASASSAPASSAPASSAPASSTPASSAPASSAPASSAPASSAPASSAPASSAPSRPKVSAARRRARR